MGMEQPDRLPVSADQCRTLCEWRNLVMGQSQRQVAELARVKQARISEVELGKVIPRRKYWPGLITAFGLTGPEAPSQFYRMLMNARQARLAAEAMTKPMSETEPLLATGVADVPATLLPIGTTNVYAPTGMIVRAQA